MPPVVKVPNPVKKGDWIVMQEKRYIVADTPPKARRNAAGTGGLVCTHVLVLARVTKASREGDALYACVADGVPSTRVVGRRYVLPPMTPGVTSLWSAHNYWVTESEAREALRPFIDHEAPRTKKRRAAV